MTDIYLGDGLYASFDGYQFRLWTQRGDGTHEVFLDSRTLKAFSVFVDATCEREERVDDPDPALAESPAEEVGQSTLGPPR